MDQALLMRINHRLQRNQGRDGDEADGRSFHEGDR
jgi:hypothetical protein